MNFGNMFKEEDSGFLMTPMLDVMFLLLIFFISTSIYYELEREIGITVPQAAEATTIDRSAHEIIINIMSDGQIIVNRQPYDIEKLENLLKRISEVSSGQAVIIRGDRTTDLGRAIEVLDVCARTKIWNVSFAAIEEESAGAQQ
jgi:biopolymer transport protein ExbD